MSPYKRVILIWFSELLSSLQFLENNQPELVLVPKRHILGWQFLLDGMPRRYHDGVERSRAWLSQQGALSLLPQYLPSNPFAALLCLEETFKVRFNYLDN